MNRMNMQLCIWSGPLGFLVLFIGVWPLAHFLPPLVPSDTAARTASIFLSNSMGIRTGCILMMLGSGLIAPLFAALAVLMKRMEGEHAPLAVTAIIVGTILVIAVMLPPILWAMAAFRADRAPDSIQLLNDVAWVLFIAPVLPGFIQLMATALAILGDRNSPPVLPRWAGFFTLWMAVLTLPSAVIVLFQTGPFAWNGLLGFWVPVSAAGIWIFGIAVLMSGAVRRLD